MFACTHLQISSLLSGAMKKLRPLAGLVINLLVFLPASSEAQSIILLDSISDFYNAGSDLEIYQDVDKKLSYEDIFEPESIQWKIGKEADNNYSSDKAYWVRIHLLCGDYTSSSAGEFYLSLGMADFIDVYQLDSLGQLKDHFKSGKMYPSGQKSMDFGLRYQRIKFQALPGQNQQLIMRYERLTKHPVQIAPVLSKRDFYENRAYLVNTNRNWLVIGFLITMVLLHLAFYLGVRDNAFLFHACYIFFVFVFISDYYGLLADLILIRDYPILISYSGYISSAFLSVSYILFVRAFLDSERNYPNWDRILGRLLNLVVMVLLAVLIFFYWTSWEPLADKIMAGSIVLVFLVVQYFLFSLLNAKDPKIYLLTAGSTMILLAVVLNAWSLIHNRGIWTIVSEICVTAEILLFALGLAFRMRGLLNEEKEAFRLRTIDKYKNHLFTNISHEFRTPLTVISANATDLHSHLSDKAPEQIHQQLRAIEQKGDELLSMVNQMLDLTRLDAGHPILEKVYFDVIQLLRETTESNRSLAGTRMISIQYQTELNKLWLHTDREKLCTVLNNVLGNALKYTQDDGEVSICSGLNEAGEIPVFWIEITDSGIGIDTEDQLKIFDRYFRGSNSSTQSTLGSGIGLSLSKELIELLGGSISVESELGTGSRFRIELPITEKASIPDTEMLDEQKVAHSSPLLLPESSDIREIILAIDDDPDILQILHQLLSPRYTVLQARDGIRGREMAQKLLPDLILTDIAMPGLNGIELTQQLKRTELTNHIPVIILTGKASDTERLEGVKTGADGYLVKPFRPDELKIRIEKMNELRKALKKKYSNFKLVDHEKTDTHHNQFVMQLNRHIENNIRNEDYSVEELARAMHISRMQLHRKLKAISDRSASNYIRSYRLQRALKLLRDLSKSISEVAFECGFSDPNYFGKSFAKEFGYTPSEFRKRE